MTTHPRASVAVALVLLPAVAWACGSMGLDEPRTRAVLAGAILAPMVLLVPVEMAFLKWVGGLHGRVIWAYLACLPAKAAGVVGVAVAAAADIISSVVVAELAYSAGHLVFAFMVLRFGFDLRGGRLWGAALCVSTVVPWLYSLGFWGIVVAAG